MLIAWSVKLTAADFSDCISRLTQNQFICYFSETLLTNNGVLFVENGPYLE